jgi:hypothetical protein
MRQMMRIFYGDDRIKARAEIDRLFGDDYEVWEGESLSLGDLPSLFLGASLFSEKRKILVKDLAENAECWSELPKYLDSLHDVVIWEAKLDKRTATYKELAKQKIKMQEFKLAEVPEKKLAFDIFDVIWQGDGEKAIEMIEKIETTNDAYMFMGLMISQAMRKMESGNRKAIAVVKLLAEYDMKMKNSVFESWNLVKAVAVKLASS